MSNTRYRRGGIYAADMASYVRVMSSDNSAQMERLKRNLVRALQEDVTSRQRQVLLLYYGERMNMREIGERLGGGKTTGGKPRRVFPALPRRAIAAVTAP